MPETRHYYLGPWIWQESPEESFWRAPDGALGLVDLRPIAPTSESGFFTTAERLADETGYLYLGGGHLSTLAMSPAMIAEWRARLQITDTIQPCTLLDLLWDTLTIHSDPDGDGRALPLMPTHRGVLELHLGGHSLVKSAKWDGKDTPHWDKVLRVLKRSGDEIKKRDKALHGKWLSAMAAKFRVDRKEIDPKGKPEKPATAISDDFNRANGAIGNSAEGWSWAADTGTWNIVSNRARVTETTGSVLSWYCRANTNLSSDDHYAQVDIILGSSTTGMGSVVRHAAAANTKYYTYNRLVDHAYGKLVEGTSTAFYLNSTEGLGNITSKLQADGSTITWYVGGELYKQTTDTAITGNLQCGLTGKNSGNADNFTAEDLLAATGLVSKMQQMGA